MNVIGLSAFYHESACCLFQDGRLIAAAEEERFSRVKHDAALPTGAFRFCLRAAGLDITDLDCIAWYEDPVEKLARQLWSSRGLRGAMPWLDCARSTREIRGVLGYEGPIRMYPHHLSHAASASFVSGFEDAAVLVVDGVGEWATVSYAHAKDGDIEILEEVDFPHSIGLFYSAITSYLGFHVNSGEYKVMGLAPYGEPRFLDEMRSMLCDGPAGSFTLDLSCFEFLRGNRMFSDVLSERLGGAPRAPETDLTPFHADVAASAQRHIEDLLLAKVRYLRELTGARDLCLAGGVALNCVANGRILREGPFRRLFVQPAAGDAGGALGAAALASRDLGAPPPCEPLRSALLGPAYSDAEVIALLTAAAIPFTDFRGDESGLLNACAARIAAGGVLAWFHGSMEFGPRALGARSILADPRDPAMRERLNGLVKKREAFRPFAPSVTVTSAPECFELDHPSPFMLETCQVREEGLPAITHVDGSARPQTVDPTVAPRFAALLEQFTPPVLVNTSFNVRDEPIVCTPLDALRCFLGTEIDALVLESCLIDRAQVPPELAHHIIAGAPPCASTTVSDVLYTFL